MFSGLQNQVCIFFKCFDVFQPGLLLPAVVNHHQSYGMFIELPGGLRGLVPRRVCPLLSHAVPVSMNIVISLKCYITYIDISDTI